MGKLMRAFPRSPGSSIYVVQNLDRRTEYEVDTEAMTCNCKAYEFRRKCRHVEYAVYRAKLYAGDRASYEQFLGYANERG